MATEKRWWKMVLVVLGILVGINVLAISVGSLLRQTYFRSRFNQITRRRKSAT